MANNYMRPVDNYFDVNDVKLEDVDDDEFLYNSRVNDPLSPRNYDYGYGAGAGAGAGAMGGGRSSRSSTNPFDEPQQVYADRRREIEERSIDATQRSLQLLYETEEVGKQTAIELAKQRDQLVKTSQKLEEIHTNLRFTQRHLNSLKSVFGGLKNYISGNRDVLPPPPPAPSGSPPYSAQASGFQSPTQASEWAGATGGFGPLPGASVATSPMSNSPTFRSPTRQHLYDDHPISRLRDDSTAFKQREQLHAQRRNNPFEAQLESNLEEMCDNLSRLKFLATDLGSEIESQNEMLDNMNYKIEDVDLKMGKQNKEMYKLLGRK